MISMLMMLMMIIIMIITMMMIFIRMIRMMMMMMMMLMMMMLLMRIWNKIKLIMMTILLIPIPMLTLKALPPALMLTFSQRRGGLLQHRATTDHFRGRNRSCQGAPEPLNPRIRSCQENQGNRHCSNNNNSHKEARHRNQCSH